MLAEATLPDSRVVRGPCEGKNQRTYRSAEYGELEPQ